MKNPLQPRLQRGSTPLLISVPHAGIAVPEHILRHFSETARSLPDTDWYVDRLYGWAADTGAGILFTPVSRYVIDVNRPPDDAPLYGSSETSLLTGLVPVRTFLGEPVYLPGREPDEREQEQRASAYWHPYHERLQAELMRIRSRHGHAVLLDAHSIRSRLPLLFEGRLPDLNLGSDNGNSAANSLLEAAVSALADPRFSMVRDGRFKGGYITRHYGAPHNGIHALQLEMAQCAYMREEPPQWNAKLARPMQAVLKRLVQVLLKWNPDNVGCDRA